MDLLPTGVFFVKGAGISKDRLCSFELALRDAGIQRCNLVNVSSIFPPKGKVISKEEGLKLLKPGQITYCVMERNETNEPNRLISAAIGLAIPKGEEHYGYLSEYHAFGEKAEKTGDYAEDLAATMLATTLGIKFDINQAWKEREQIYKASGHIFKSMHICQSAEGNKDGLWTSIVAVAVFVFEENGEKSLNFGGSFETGGSLINNFAYKDSKIVILPVPYDKTSTWLKGADKGPNAIMEASANLEMYDIETDSEVYKKGIFTENPVKEDSSPKDMIDAVSKKVTEHIKKGKFVVTVGGEHSVSIGAVKSHVDNYPKVCVLQLDAHTDLRDEYRNSKLNHACVMARIKEMCPIVQVGIRNMALSEKKKIDKSTVFFAEDIYSKKDWVKKVVNKLDGNVYITIDLDVFDHSIMPSTGTPEPGGLSWYDAIGLLKQVIKEKNVIGFDVVELCPNEHNKAPDFLAAKLIYKLLSYKFSDHK